MPVVAADTGLIYRPEQAVEMIAELLQDNGEQLGIQYVGKYEERLIPRYPSVIVSAGMTEKEVHATHTFAITLRSTIWVYHANLTKTHQQRSLEDLELATAVVALLEDDFTWKEDGVERLVFGFVESEVPGVIAPRSGRGEPVVGTKLEWNGTTQKRWA